MIILKKIKYSINIEVLSKMPHVLLRRKSLLASLEDRTLICDAVAKTATFLNVNALYRKETCTKQVPPRHLYCFQRKQTGPFSM